MKFLQNTKIKFFLIVIGHVVAFISGSYLTQDVIRKSYGEVEAFNTFARYEASRDIARFLKNDSYEDAKCRADLEASSGYDYVKRCMNDERCSRYLWNDIQARAPEILGDTSLGFDYLTLKNGERHCN